MRWGIVPCCVGPAVLLVGTTPHPPPAGAPSPQGEGFAGELGCRCVLASVTVSGVPSPSPGGEGGLRCLNPAAWIIQSGKNQKTTRNNPKPRLYFIANNCIIRVSEEPQRTVPLCHCSPTIHLAVGGYR